eukprot:5944030-Alexandrium_andersonii.AAC.1
MMLPSLRPRSRTHHTSPRHDTSAASAVAFRSMCACTELWPLTLTTQGTQAAADRNWRARL